MDIQPKPISTRFNDIQNQTFNRLTAIGYLGRNVNRAAQWLFKCDCGNEHVALAASVISGHTKSCGCWRVEDIGTRRTTHGATSGRKVTPEYTSWACIIQRCTNPKNQNFPDYGERGVTVCDRWKESFTAFLEDMGLRPSPKHKVERIDNSKGYSPDNCKWADDFEQARNRRSNHLLTFNGQTMCIAEWAERLHMPSRCLQNRISTYKWSVERALTEPVRQSSRSVHAG